MVNALTRTNGLSFWRKGGDENKFFTRRPAVC